MELNDWKNRDAFQKAIGHFSIEFSRLELGVTELASFSIDDIRYWQVEFKNVFGLSLEVKRDLVKKFIKKEIPDIYPTWKSINEQIGLLNHERRHLIHGTGESYLFHTKMTTTIKNNGIVESKTYTISDIKSITNRVAHVNTGEHGILGSFNTEFKTAAINWYNQNAARHERIVYKVNNDIVTDWKG